MTSPETPHSLPPTADALHAHVATALHGVDQRYTVGRRRLVELLLSIGRPATLPELSEAEPDIPTSSMYRNLEVLERHQLVRRITTGSDHAHYELSEPIVGHHHHLICTSCGGVDDIEPDPSFETQIDAYVAAAAEPNRFVVHQHTLDLHGLCASCQ